MCIRDRLTTLAIVLLTGFLGVNLVRWQGVRAWNRITQQLSAGQLPSQEILDGVLILIAGAFLLTPGPITDLAGFSLLVPSLRRWIGRRLQANLFRGVRTQFESRVWTGDPNSAVHPTPEWEEAPVERPRVRVIHPED